MKMIKSIYNRIIDEQKSIPPETGGIIGGSSDVVSIYEYDEGIQSDKMCSYIPNIKLLNEVIKKWQNEDILFMGIYHVHFWNVETLSKGDSVYIEKIIRNMPEKIGKLYFPIVVMPKRHMVVYTAKIVSGKVVVDKEEIELLD